MLDELKEYDEYTCSLDETSEVRLMPEIFKKRNKLSGLHRALVIIARKELADRGYFDENIENHKQIRDEVTQTLREWLGFCDVNDKKYSTYDSWLKRYCLQKIQFENSKEEAEFKNQIEYKRKKYESKLLEEEHFKKNTVMEVTYEKIIAEAIFLGPLERYYLVCKQGYDRVLYKDKLIDVSRKKGAEYVDNILKMICVYLIGKENTHNLYNRVNYAELGHWAAKKEIPKGEYFKGLHYKDEALLSIETVDNCFSKIMINKSYLQNFDFRVVTESRLKDFSEDGYCRFKDCGSGKQLKRI